MIWRFFQICRWIFDFRLGADLPKLAVSKLFRTKLFPLSLRHGQNNFFYQNPFLDLPKLLSPKSPIPFPQYTQKGTRLIFTTPQIYYYIYYIIIYYI